MKLTLVAALNHFFSPPKISMAEMKALTPDDRAYFKRELEKAGYEIVAATS